MPAQPAAREPEEDMETEGDSEVPQANGEAEEEREREGGEAEETMEESGEEHESDRGSESEESEAEEEEGEESSGDWCAAHLVVDIYGQKSFFSFAKLNHWYIEEDIEWINGSIVPCSVM